MGDLLVILIVAATSVAAWALNVSILRLGHLRLRILAGDVLECLGFCVIFLTTNLAAGMLTVFLLRAVTSWFFTLYVFTDVILVPLSFVQGVTLFCWRRQSKTSNQATPARL